MTPFPRHRSHNINFMNPIDATLSAIGAMLLASCAAPTAAPPRAMPAPIQSAAVSPLVDLARADAVKGGEVSSRLESKVETLQRTTGELRAGIGVATAEADRLRKQKTASEKELASLWQMLTDSDEHARRLFEEVEKAKAIADEQRAHRMISDRRLDELARAAIARDVETQELRNQRDHLAAELARAEASYAKQGEKLRKAEMRAAVGTYLKGVGWFIGLVIVLVVAIRVIAFFKPF